MNDESKADASGRTSTHTSTPGIASWLSVLFAGLSGLYLLAGGVWLVAIGGRLIR